MSNTHFTLGFQIKDVNDKWTDLLEVAFDGFEHDTIATVATVIGNGFRPDSILQTAALQLHPFLVKVGAGESNPAKALRIVIARTRLRVISQRFED